MLDRTAAWIEQRVGSLLPLLLTLSMVQGLLWAWAEFGMADQRIAPAHALTLLGAGLYQPDHDLPIYLCGALVCVLADALFVALLARPALRTDAANGPRIELLACIAVVLLPSLAPDSTRAWLAACVFGVAFVARRTVVRARAPSPARPAAGPESTAPAAVSAQDSVPRRGAFARDCALPLAILALVVFVPWPRILLWQTYDTDQFHHLDFYVMAPALAHAHGLRLGTDFYAQYGVGWPLVMDALGRVTGERGYSAFIRLEMIVGFAYFLGLFIFLRSWLRNAQWATVGLLLALALALFTDTADTPKWIWPSSTVLRYAFDLALFAILLAHARRGDARLGPAAGVVLALQSLCSTDVGLYLLFAFFVYVVCAARRAGPDRPPGPVLRFALGAAVAWVLVAGAGYTWANQGQLPGRAFWSGLGESVIVYGRGIANLPITQAIRGNNGLALLLLMMLATYFRSVGAALHACWAGAVTTRQSMRAAIAAYGLGTLMIFIGRSHEQNLMHVVIPWCLLLAESAGAAMRAPVRRANAVRASLALSAVLTLFIVAQAAAMSYPNLVDGAAGLLASPPAEGSIWIDRSGDPLPVRQSARLAVFRAASEAIRRSSDSGRHSVAVIGYSDTAYLVEAGVAPYFRYSPVLANLLFKEQVDGVTRRIADAPPDWIFIDVETDRALNTARLADSTAAILAAIKPVYVRDGSAGQFEIYRKASSP